MELFDVRPFLIYRDRAFFPKLPLEQRALDTTEDVAELKRAAANGDAKAMVVLYYKSICKPGGFVATVDEALQWYWGAVQRDEPEALLHAGAMLNQPESDRAARYTGLGMYEKAASAGLARALTYIGHFRLEEKNSKAAFAWFLKGARAGDPSAMKAVALLYLNGEGVEIDYGKAAKWFRRGAQKGHVQCMLCYGLLLRSSVPGVARNPDEANVWFERAHAAGSVAVTREDVPIGSNAA